jgi:Trk K+ transport system NAD-binding subunit
LRVSQGAAPTESAFGEARGDDRIDPGDRIIVFSTGGAAERVQAYFSGTRN